MESKRKGAVATLLFFCNSPFHRSQRKCIDAIIPLEFLISENTSRLCLPRRILPIFKPTPTKDFPGFPIFPQFDIFRLLIFIK